MPMKCSAEIFDAINDAPIAHQVREPSARKNMAMEITGKSFDDIVQSTRKEWQKNLSRIKVGGVTEDQKSIFYTAMFHTMQFPREMSEYGKYYSGFDDKVHTGNSYTDFSLWDTYRALHPLLLFTQPERINPMITAMLQMYKEGGRNKKAQRLF